ncbi:MAG: YggS family pyridoxal phosphate-dependent enzyme [Caulobacteraceae bacterium]
MTDARSRPDSVFDAAAARADILERIAAAARAAGRDPASVSLTAVSKTQPEDRVAAVLAAGQARVRRRTGCRRRSATGPTGGEGLELRLIGPLQTNKAREAAQFFDVIETLDRARLAESLAHEVQRLGRQPRLYVEINTGEEPQKAGLAPPEADAFIARCRGEFGLTLEGLMCIPPQDEPPGPQLRPHRPRIAARNGLARLSMGMSADFETAIRFGATSVRVGTALFGARHGPASLGPPGGVVDEDH